MVADWWVKSNFGCWDGVEVQLEDRHYSSGCA